MLDLTIRSFSSSHGSRLDFSGDLQASKNAVVADAEGYLPLLTVDIFFNIILPLRIQHVQEPTAQVVPKILQQLVKSKAYSTRRQRWEAFPEDPADSSDEGVVFQGFSDIATAIDEAFRTVYDLSADIHATTEMLTEPNRIPKHVHRATKSRPDGIFLLRKRTMPGKIRWVDVAACGEFKLKDNVKNRNDDVDKALWSLHHLMREDPRRRFAFAFTVENRKTRLLFCNRSQFAISKPFDFCSEPEKLIHYFLTLLYASDTELGFDPTMQRIIIDENDENPQYDITVTDSKTGETTVYRTLELLSNVSTFTLRGRGTRVWRARRLENGRLSADRDVAIRDNWVDDDRLREVDVHEQIVADIPDDRSADSVADNREVDVGRLRDEFRKHLLTIVASGDVIIDGKKDITLQAYASDDAIYKIRQQDDRPAAVRRKEAQHKSLQSEVKNHHYTVGDAHPAPHTDKQHRYHVKAHHRIVYGEVGVTLNSVSSLKDALWYICQASQVLQFVHSAGWVHRDISGGNILVVDGVVKLADFEYAKKFSSDIQSKRHDVRTGTDAFMSVEVKDERFWFEPKVAQSRVANKRPFRLPSAIGGASPDFPSSSDANPLENVKIPPPVVWRYNPLHDMESIWWLAVYFVFDKDVMVIPKPGFKTVPAEFVESDHDRRTRLSYQNAFCAPIFRALNSVQRLAMLSAPRHLINAASSYLHRSLQGNITVALEAIRQSLVETYTIAEQSPSEIKHTVAQEVYDTFTDALTTAARYANHPEWFLEVRSLAGTVEEEGIPPPPPAELADKRALEDDDEQADDSSTGGSSRDEEGPARKRAKI